MQLQEHKFTAWLDRLVEARKNRQDKRQQLYRSYRKWYRDDSQPGENKWTKPQLCNKMKPAQELEVQQIMDINCEHDDVVEAVDLNNRDVDKCQTAWRPVGYNPDVYFVSNKPTEEICIVDEFQRRGTAFAINIDIRDRKPQFFALMDTRASRSCINYSTFSKWNVQLSLKEVPKVIGADGSDLGFMALVELTLILEENKVKQEFILGVDFAKSNCARLQWTNNRTRVLLLNRIKAVEVKENELGIPVTASYHVRVPPRHNTVFKVNINADMRGVNINTGNRHLMEKHPNLYRHEISIIAEKETEMFPLIAITNQVLTLHLAKGEAVWFAKPESPNVMYVATTNELNIEETLDTIPRNWIDEMFLKLGGTTVFSTIDLRSGYYHISLTRESSAKSAFVVPMGKWQFKWTLYRLSQAPAYFQLLIDKVLMGCSSFAMRY